MLRINLTEIDVCADIFRVVFQNFIKSGDGVFGAILRFGDESENILRLRLFGRSGGGDFGGF